MKTNLTLVSTSLVGIFVFAGCYTLLKHPRLEVEPATVHLHDNAANHVASSDDCLRCHEQADDYYNETLPYSDYYGGRSRNWLYFYDSPWWAEPYYYGGAVTENAEELPSPRTFGRRHSNPQGAPMGTQPAVAPSAGSGATPVVAKRANSDGGNNNESGGVEGTQKRIDRRENPQTDGSKQERRVRKRTDESNHSSKPSTVPSVQKRNERQPTPQVDKSKQKRRVRKKENDD